MKRAKQIIFVLMGIICILGSSYLIWREILTDPYVPRGYTSCEENREEIPWMDWTNFCWYQYESDNKVDLPAEYTHIEEKDIIFVKGYFDDTRMHLEGANRLDEYTFDPACINEGDSWLLFTSEGEPRGNGVYGRYDDYNLYYFDEESARLYYLNNNF